MKKPSGMPGIGGSLGQCALCGENFLLEIILGKSVPSFEVGGCSNTLFGHDKCLKKLRDGMDWEDLPAKSPLREAYQKSKNNET